MTMVAAVRHWIILAAVLWFAAGASHAQTADAPRGNAPDAQVRDLLNGLGRKVSDFKTLQTDFTQEKEMAMFKEKVVLKGRIYLEKPNKVAWHVDSPLRFSILITDKLVRQWDEDTDQVQEISLTKNPIIQNVLNQLTVWFSGDYSALLETNDARMVKQEPLVFEFRPRDKNPARKVIRSITITFRDDQKYLQQIRINELNGDVTTLRFMNTILNTPLDSGAFEVRGHV